MELEVWKENVEEVGLKRRRWVDDIFVNEIFIKSNWIVFDDFVLFLFYVNFLEFCDLMWVLIIL